MRFIQKTKSPDCLENWKEQRKNAGQSLSYSDFKGDPRKDFKTYVLKEQKYLCCYCQQVIGLNSSTIEHFLPQTDFKLHQVEYLNLFLGCKCSRGLKGSERYCDVSKENELIINLLLHPKCESFFKYSSEGEILPNNKHFTTFDSFKKNRIKLNLLEQQVLILIEILNLNANDLTIKRKKTIKDISKLIPKMTTKKQVEDYIQKAKDSVKNPRFPSLVKYFLQLHIENL